MRKALVLLVLLAALVSFAGASSFYSVNGSEPAFLKDIGPQEERADSIVAALVVALGVSAVILRGLRRHDRD